MFGFNKDECWNSDYDSTWEDEEPPYKMQKPQNWHRSGNRSARDMQRYRHGYDKADLDTADDPDSPEKMPNLLFYQNQMAFQPYGETIEDIYRKWWDDYKELEANHSYIQWLFPLREPGVNPYATPLTQAEIKRMRADEVVMQRLLKSYKLMLRFYGIQLLDEKTGEVSRAAEWKERYHNLSRHSHNNLRITRILKCLGEMGYDHLQAPLVQFFLEETLCNKQLPNVKRSVLDYFMFTVKDKQQRRRLVQFAWENYTSRGPFIWGPVDKLQNLRAKKEKENEGTTEEMESKEENPGPPCKDLHQHLQHQTRTEDMGDDSRSGVGRIQDHQASEQRDAVTRSRNEQQTTEDNSSGFELQITEDSSSATKQLITEYCSSGNEQLKTENNSLRNERPITEDNEGLTTAETSSVNKNLITRTTQHGEHQAEGSENEEKEKLMSGQEDRIGNNGILDILLSFGGFCCFLCCMSGSSNVRKG
ncbi:opioid growth factor receptor-like [Ranitomeya imitator]|uniref:opioid growth factor receptor-like n=1 Tax=Ranitomeya imitator TaxID=111125 RepID=UPI0037E78F12